MINIFIQKLFTMKDVSFHFFQSPLPTFYIFFLTQTCAHARARTHTHTHTHTQNAYMHLVFFVMTNSSLGKTIYFPLAKDFFLKVLKKQKATSKMAEHEGKKSILLCYHQALFIFFLSGFEFKLSECHRSQSCA